MWQNNQMKQNKPHPPTHTHTQKEKWANEKKKTSNAQDQSISERRVGGMGENCVEIISWNFKSLILNSIDCFGQNDLGFHSQ